MADWRDEEERVDVILVEHGPRKINVIKILRDVLGLGLGEGKDFIESLPRVVKQGVSLDEGRALRDRFEQAGAIVDLEARPPR
ncbi:MAG: large subunit ribosomal protein [Sphingomonadales bacterium]|jgi:large subunit ribosomal protein L7/L12|nr:large subunit ribosomal protein [Sphingomonadales bacterium]